MMKEKEKLVYLLLQLVSLLVLLVLLRSSGMAVLLGEIVATTMGSIVAFGVFIISMTGVGAGYLLKTRRHRIYRDTQIHIFKYLATLGALQVMAMFVTGAFGVIPGELIERITPIVGKVVTITFSVMAFIIPINYLKSLFSMIKSVEFRDPRSVVKDFF